MPQIPDFWSPISTRNTCPTKTNTVDAFLTLLQLQKSSKLVFGEKCTLISAIRLRKHTRTTLDAIKNHGSFQRQMKGRFSPKNSLGVLLGCKSARNVSAVFVLVEQVLRVENGDQIQEFEAGSIEGLTFTYISHSDLLVR